ncbi:SCO family protein [Rhodothermus marinus]|jgi:protein SCO1/2|uniref:SCO family protein n=1 Tax=Rhodothermus marinus TaxID=29549 RepID=UPI001E0A9763|nr:SCO family protein [Rhodothermus marinus]MBO2493092.1 redoxin domain-containing protein [Rhodothermus marinus]
MPRLLLLAALLLWTGCRFSRTYEVRGRVVGFGDDPHTLFIQHEEIPGYMPAMTMPFRTPDTAAVARLSLGDPIAFTFHVTRDSAWITDIRRLPPGTRLNLDAGPRPTLHGLPLLQEGDPLPDATLLTQDSLQLRLSDLQGRALLLTFIYTRCPVPDFCPLMSRRFQQLQEPLKARFGDHTRLLTISFDPAYDTPSVLRRYAQQYTDDTRHWIFATGDTTTIRRLATQFGVHYEAAAGEIIHNLTTALVAPDGRIGRIWRGNRWTTDEVLAAVAEVLADTSATR